MSTLGRSVELRPPEARRDHIHLVAILYVGATFMLLLGAMSSQNNLLFATVGLALATVIVSGFFAGSSMMGLRFARQLPVRAEAGRQTRLTYHVSNANRFMPAYALRLTDHALGPNDRAFKIHAGISRVPAKSEVRTLASVTFPARGRWTLGPGRILTMFPFGISKKSMRFGEQHEIIVQPRKVTLRPGVLGVLESLGDEGRADTRRKGGGAELYNLREYQRGDPVSTIAWQASARWGQLISREVAAPQTKRVWIVIETSEDELASRTEIAESAVRLALAAGIRLHSTGVAAGLAVPSCGIYVPPDETHLAHPTWALRLATLGDEHSSRTHAKALTMSDGIVAIGAGITPGTTIALHPNRESSYIQEGGAP